MRRVPRCIVIYCNDLDLDFFLLFYFLGDVETIVLQSYIFELFHCCQNETNKLPSLLVSKTLPFRIFRFSFWIEVQLGFDFKTGGINWI